MRTYCLAIASLAITICATTQAAGFQDEDATKSAEPVVAVVNAEPIKSETKISLGDSFAKLDTKPAAQKAAQPVQAGEVAKEGGVAKPGKPAGNGKIRFTFSEQDWSDVIPWFAEQANFSLQPVADYPEGVFTLKDDSEYTVLEALDQLNHALMIRQPEPYTLIRNRNMLLLWKLRDANFPNDLIETVKVEDLDKRGKHETISCIFDMGELNAEGIGDQLRPLISRSNQDFFAVFPTANQIHVRETGGQLRKIRDLINASFKKEFGDEMKLKVYNLKNQDAESFMGLARGLLGIRKGSNMRDDEKLLISVEPFAERLFIRGNEKWLSEFDNVAKIIDADPEEIVDGVVLDAPTLQMYSVLVDPQLAFDTLQTMLESRDDVRMQQDSLTGAITVLGRKEDHKLVADTLAAISGEGGEGFALIQLENGDPAEIIIVLQNLFRQSAEDTSGPVLLANSYTRQIIVRGTPQEVQTVKRMVAELDANSLVAETGPRSTTRIISIGEREMKDLAPLLPDLLMSAGRTNPFNMIMPKDRKDVKESIKKQKGSDSVEDFLNGVDIPGDEKPDQSRRYTPGQKKTSQLNPTFNELLFLTANAVGISPIFANGLVSLQADSASESTERQVGSTYQPPPEIKSVPGAPIVGRFSNGSLVLDSEDLDALDDLVYEIENRIGSTSEVQRPTFFFLEHRSADQMIGFLENYYGMSDGGGGGGGGGLMEGMMSNMLGGGEDLLGGLLGGGTGSSGGGDLEGDVRFGVDMAFNSMWVSGATENDLDEISILIDTLDQPEAPHDPKLLGQFRTIDIIHRDPMDVKDIIEPMLGDLVDSGEQARGGRQNNEAQQMMKMVQQLSGGGGKRGGGSGGASEGEKPKVRLGVDMATRQLLVSGPEFIYKDILKMVIELDKPELSTPPGYEIMTNVNNQAAVVDTLKQMFGARIVVVGEEEQEAGGTNNQGTNSGNQTSTAQRQSSDAARSALMDAMKAQANRARGGGGGGNARGGGNTRGGGRGGLGSGAR